MTLTAPRPATSVDAGAIAECVRAAYLCHVERIGQSPGPMLQDYGQVVRNHHAYVVEEGGRIVGVLVLMDTADGILLDNVAVLPSRQGEGLGRRLVEFAESEARRLGHGCLDLYTHQRMVRNIAMYARYGYEEFDRRTEEGGFPRVYMRKRL